jgi:hypothetical protein
MITGLAELVTSASVYPETHTVVTLELQLGHPLLALLVLVQLNVTVVREGVAAGA